MCRCSTEPLCRTDVYTGRQWRTCGGRVHDSLGGPRCGQAHPRCGGRLNLNTTPAPLAPIASLTSFFPPSPCDQASKRISRTSTTWTRGNGLGDGYGLKVPITFPSVPDTLLTCAGASTAPTWGCICSFLVVATIVYHRGTEWMIGTLAVTALFSSCSDRCSRVATVELSWPKQEVRNGGSYPNVCGCCLFVALLAWRCPTELGAQGFVRSAAYWFALHTPCAWLYLFVLALIRLAAYVINSVAVRHAQPSAICRLPTCGAALNTNLSRCHP